MALRYACLTNSFDSLVMTHLDVYDTLDEIKVCVAYRIGDRLLESFPASSEALNTTEPVFHNFPDWKRPISNALVYAEFPVGGLRGVY